ncbi:MAG: hypothetical protein M0R75_03555 [Dehalococcoidia bacterium]|nr:hypothetical protein [Dehalococcoidia bacterium]
MAAAGFLGFALVVLAFGLRDHRADDRFDLVRWELDTFPNRWLAVLASPFRDAALDEDEVLRAYFALPPEDPGRAEYENEVERIIEGRITQVLSDLGLSARIDPPRGVFPPVDVELAISPQVLVTSPRDVIERKDTDLLRPDIEAARALEIEADAEEADPDLAALVVPSGGVATYPAIVSDRSSYAGVLGTSAHEWVHHYLAFYPLGFNYYRSGDLRTINETVADIVGEEVAGIALERWGDPTAVPATAAAPADDVPPPPPGPTVDRNAVLRALRLEVDALLAAGRIEEAEARMDEVRDELEAAGYYLRKINQAYFAWYGTYAARPDAVDPLGGYLREVRARTGSPTAYLETIREWTSRADVEDGLVELGGTLVTEE